MDPTSLISVWEQGQRGKVFLMLFVSGVRTSRCAQLTTSRNFGQAQIAHFVARLYIPTLPKNDRAA